MEDAFKILKIVNSLIDSNELTQAIKAEKFDGEYALSEDGIEAIKSQLSGLMTREAALRDKKVRDEIASELYPVQRKTALKKVESQLKEAYEVLGIDYSDVEFISDKADLIPEAIKSMKIADKGKVDNKELIESLKAERLKLAQEKDAIEASWVEKFNEQEKSYKEKFLKDKFLLKATSKPFITAYEEDRVKKGILNDIYDELNSQAHLTLSESGEIQLFEKDFPDKELLIGNKKAEFQNLLDEKLERYLQKSKPASNEIRTGQTVVNDAPELTPMQRSIRQNAQTYQR